MNLYPWIKTIHVTTVSVSGCLFLVRYLWMLQDSRFLRKTWVKIVPHVNDTLLLLSGITMAIQLRQYPLTHSWLTAKLVALLAYIILGSIALKRGKTLRQKQFAGVLALSCFFYIVSVALTRTPLPIPIS